MQRLVRPQYLMEPQYNAGFFEGWVGSLDISQDGMRKKRTQAMKPKSLYYLVSLFFWGINARLRCWPPQRSA
jgi:hypothetical protein